MKHEIVQDLKRVTQELGHVPSFTEYHREGMGQISERQVKKHFGTFLEALKAAGLNRDEHTEGKKKFKYVQPLRDGTIFKKTVRIDLAELFRKAGNPEFLTAIVMPDTHNEHVDPWALNCFLEVLHHENPDIFICLGDFLDAGGISHWPSNSLSPQRFVPEVLKGREVLGIINSILPKAVFKGFIEGNHEDWIRQFMVSGNNPQFFDGIEALGYDFSTSAFLGLDALGFDFFPLNQIVRIGNAAFTHGLYTGANHAKKHLDEVKSSIFYGHCHDTKAHSGVSIEGPMVAQSLACLCDLSPSFLRGLLNNWEHGFGKFVFYPDGSFTHTVPKILNGRAVINGKLFKA